MTSTRMAPRPSAGAADPHGSPVRRGGGPGGRLRWRCRRGARETDLMLERFLHAAGETLDEDTEADLERLLEQPDPDILDWLTGRTRPPDDGLATLIGRIRTTSCPFLPE